MIILIDGRSGAGKTTFAEKLGRDLDMRVLHMDDFYTGWEGLQGGIDAVAGSLLKAGTHGAWSWDWENNCKGSWIELTNEDKYHFILEGVGAASDPIIEQISKITGVKYWALVMVEEDKIRKERALKRDPGYAPFWDLWSQQEENLKYLQK
ncbi:MAG: hypothetical protein Q3962_00270 [Corynebacterium sp.]|nr:hypothetical protein [Corynebacterium sp.]